MSINRVDGLSRYWAYFWIVFVILLFAAALLKKPEFDSSLTSLLPDAEQRPVVGVAKDKLTRGFEDKLVIVLQGSDVASLKEVVGELAVELESLSVVESVKWRVDGDKPDGLSSIEDHRFSVLSPEVLRQISQGEFEQLKKQAISEILSPVSGRRLSVLEDPFGLNIDYLRHLNSQMNFEVDAGLLKVKKSELPAYLIFVSFNRSAFDPEVQTVVTQFLQHWSSTLAPKNISLLKSGMVLHAAAGAEQAKAEMNTIGLGSLVGIILCILLVFKRFSLVPILLLPIIIGSIAAFSVTVLFFEKVHLVTLAFGAGLVGVSIDYALHYLCERHKNTAQNTFKKLLPGMCLGLLTSVLAYSAQALAPFPGLRQMALFSVVGLIGAWLTVMLCFPLLTANMELAPLKTALWLGRVKGRFPRMENQPLLMLGMLLISLLAIVMIVTTKKSIELRSLQSPSDTLLAEDAKIQKLLELTSSTKFLLISGDNLENALQVEESLLPGLEKLTIDGDLSGYVALSQQLPSLEQQQQNIALVSALYEAELDDFFALLGLGEDHAKAAKRVLEAKKEYLLSYDDQSKPSGAFNWSDSVIVRDENVSTIIRLKGDLSKEAELKITKLALQSSQIEFVDRVEDISSLLKRYQEQILYWVLAAYLLIALILYLRYQLGFWRVILPPFVACALSLAVISQLEGSLNIFHLMAMILVIGIGLDLGIFMVENNGSDHTWCASSLSCYTSILAFGLLALSDTQVLHHFGMTVLIGLVCVWLISPLVRKDSGAVKMSATLCVE